MKTKYILSFISVFILATLLYALSQGGHILTWQETSVADFFDNERHNLIIKNNSGGEVRLPDPIVKTANDHINNSIPRGTAYDSDGNYLRVWVVWDNIFAQKFTASGDTLSPKIRVNDKQISNAFDTKFRSALLDNGSFCVVWTDQGSNDNTMYGQAFSALTIKGSANFIINEVENGSNHIPAVWANNNDGNFWILYSRQYNGKYKILVQKRDIQGSQIDSSFVLNPDNPTNYEAEVSVTSGENGSFVVAWGGNNENTSTAADVYIRKFSAAGQPLTQAVKAIREGKSSYQGHPSVCKDDDGNYLAAWTDARDNHSTTSVSFNIYGQFFNPELKKLGINFRINTKKYSWNSEPDIRFRDNAFEISWLADTGTKNVFYVARWSLNPQENGEMISTILDTGPEGAEYAEIAWDASVPDTTSLRFQIRSGTDTSALAQADWIGPNGTDDFYMNASGQSINPLHNVDRLIQYKALFHTELLGITPVLNSVSISFAPNDSIPPSTQGGVFSVPGHSSVHLYWSPNQARDIAAYRIYRGKTSGYYNWKKDIPGDKPEYVDPSVKTGTTYYYVISAIDSSLNESALSGEVTGTPEAMNVYVSPNGSPYGNGTVKHPFQTIAQGMHFAEYKDSVIVLPGEYHEAVTMKKGVSLIGKDVLKTKIFSSNGSYIVKAADETIIKGLSLIVQPGQEAYAVLCENVSPVISGSIMINFNPKSFFAAVRCGERTRPVIQKNYISGFFDGVYASNYCNPIIKNNIIKTSYRGVFALLHCEVEILNNTILVEKYAGVEMIHWSSANIKNNIIIGTDKTMGIASQSSDINARYNDVWNHNKNYAGTYAGTGSISADPLFISPGSQNYQLQEDSPCRNAGESNTAFLNTDSSRNDMGAFGGPDPIALELTSGLIKSISLTRSGGFPGDTVSAFIKIKEPAGIFKAEFSISFNTRLLSFIKIDSTRTTGGSLIKTKTTPGNLLHIGIVSPTGFGEKPDSVLRIDFKLSAAAHSGDIALLQFKNVIALDKDEQEIFFKSIADGFIATNQGSEPGRYVYVDASNESAGNGTRSNPFQSIQNAINSAASGDTVVAVEGNYPEALVLKENVFLFGAGARITRLYPPNDQIGIQLENIQKSKISGFSIIGNDSDPFGRPLLSVVSSTVDIENNRFKAGINSDSNIKIVNNSKIDFLHNVVENGGLFIESSIPKIAHNEFIGNRNNCIRCDNCTSPVIENNELTAGAFARVPLYINSGSGALIKKNIIHCEKAGGGGIRIENAAAVSLKNNIIENGNGGISIRNSSDVQVINNTVVSKGSGIDESGSTLILYNNIVIENNSFGIRFSEAAIHDYNNSWNPGDNFYQCAPDPNGMSQDPLFVDRENGIYLLSAASPCIDAGNPDIIYNDFNGTRNDMGAYGGPEADADWFFNMACTIQADSILAHANDTIRVNINGLNILGAALFETTISYNPFALDFAGAQVSDLSKNFMLTQTKESLGSVRIRLEGIQGLSAADGSLLQLQFIAKSSNDSVSVIHFSDALLSDAATRNLKITTLKDGVVKITARPEKIEPELPVENALFQCYPNPFNNSTRIKYRLAVPGKVRITIYNVLGQKIRTFLNPWQESGLHSFVWKGDSDSKEAVSSGLYFYQIKAQGFVKTKKVLLLK